MKSLCGDKDDQETLTYYINDQVLTLTFASDAEHNYAGFYADVIARPVL